MENERIVAFQEMIWEFYREHGRHDLPWRLDPAPYRVFVSEVMLQQTQVSRVQVKYAKWLRVFPDMSSLAAASVADVTRAWQGLGYNRRGLWLRQAAQMVIADYAGVLPHDPAELVKLPGIGPNTAGSVAAFAYDEPVVFIETNIRRTMIHEFFPSTLKVGDAQLLPLIEATLDHDHPREWYWALMDYGADLAKRVENPNRRSRHYGVQSKFEGSLRQVRGEVLRQLLDRGRRLDEFEIADERLGQVLAALAKEGFISENDGTFALAK